MLQALPLPALLIDGQQRIALVNAPALDLFGPDPTGRHYAFTLRQPTLTRAIDIARTTGRGGQARYVYSAGEQDHTWIAQVAALPNGEGRQVLVTFQDAGAAEGVSQQRRDFVANVSHELKTPLTALMGFIETLRGPARGDERARDHFLSMMAAEAERMDRLVIDLLSLSRVEADARIRPTDRLDLYDVVHRAVMTLTPIAGEHGAQIVTELPEGGTAEVAGDADQLQQVLSNLIENAIKYGARRVTLALEDVEWEATARGPAWRFKVIDDGPGIAADHVPRLTERFYRVDDHRSRAQGGTGLGLAIVKHIVDRHRGRLKIESVVGEGSTFSVLLPKESPRP